MHYIYKDISNFSSFKTIKKAKVFFPKDVLEIIECTKKKYNLFGNLKSYGDSVLGKKKFFSLIKFKSIDIDEKKKVADVGSGLLLNELLVETLKKKLILPCMPGTKYVTIGGMIASDIEGKVSDAKGNNIKDYIIEIKILYKNRIFICSSKKNDYLFNSVVGGLGFTGIILSAKLKLCKIQSQYISQKVIKFENFESFKKISKTIFKYNYATAWVDFSKKKLNGLYFTGKHKRLKKVKGLIEKVNITEYFIYKLFLLFINFFLRKKVFIFFFNKLFKIKNLFIENKNISIYNFFFPQDKIINFRDFFSKSGLLVFQFQLKINDLDFLYNKIRNELLKNDLFSYFVIIKFFNKKKENKISLSFSFILDKNFERIKKILNILTKKFNLNIKLSKDCYLETLNTEIIRNNNFLKKKYIFNNLNSLMFKRLIKNHE